MVPATDLLRFVQPVTREVVHRSAIAEVFITDGVRTGEGTFAVGAQWPRDHALYHPDENGLIDPLLFAETLRQIHFYAAHTYFGVPVGRHFVGQDVDFEITDPAALRVGPAPLHVVLEGEWTWEARRTAGARVEVTLLVDGRPCGRGSTRGLMVDDRRYRLLRGKPAPGAHSVPEMSWSGTELAQPQRVGRLRMKDCVLERDRPGEDWRLRIDRDHAVLFDHPTDHVPLMVMLEGCRQLGHLALHEEYRDPFDDAAFALTGMAIECLAFGEFGESIRLVVEENVPRPRPGAGRRLRIAVRQGDKLLARMGTTWLAMSRPGLRPMALAG